MKTLLTSLLLWWPLLGRSQTPMQVVTKVIEKEFPYVEGQRIQLNAQKADVMLKGWDRSSVSIRLRLIARHPDRATAEHEVTYHQYTLESETRQINISNRLVIPQRAGKLQSQLKAVYEVRVPTNSQIELTNSFGNIQVSNLTGDVSLTFEFGKLTLADIGGKLAITSSYGDIEGRGLDALLSLKAEKADVVLRDLGGTVSLQNHYCKLTLLPIATLNALTVEAIRTEILVTAKHFTDFRYNVVVASAEIRVPEELADLVNKHGKRQQFSYLPAGHKPEISIQNSYSTTILQDEKSLVNR